MPRRLISFDWALKRLLRSKAHFNILEGFLSELLRGAYRKPSNNWIFSNCRMRNGELMSQDFR